MEQFWLGHRERLRLRAQADGLDALKDHELVELVLFYAVPRADMEALARALLDEMGSPAAVFRASRPRLMAVPGMTDVIAEWIMMTGELIAAYRAVDREAMPRIWRYRDMLLFLARRWRQVPAPQSWILYTDYDDRMITYSIICDSLYWFDPIYMREIVIESLSLQARHAYLVLFMGVEALELDGEERQWVVSLSQTLRAIDVELLDCVLVGEQGFLSMYLEGGLTQIRKESKAPALYERYCDGWKEETGI